MIAFQNMSLENTCHIEIEAQFNNSIKA